MLNKLVNFSDRGSGAGRNTVPPLIGTIMVPMQDSKLAVRELDRAARLHQTVMLILSVLT